MKYTKLIKASLTEEQATELKKLLTQYGYKLAQYNEVNLYNESIEYINKLQELIEKHSIDDKKFI